MRSVRELMNLHGRVAVISGGAGHIGVALADALAECGACTVILDVQQARCDAIAAAVRQTYGVETLGLEVDLANEAQVRTVCPRVIECFGHVDILVNCAAFVGSSALQGWTTPFLEQRSDTWRQALEVNLTAAFVLTQSCAVALTASGHGAVINISSIYGMVGPDLRLYEGTIMGSPAAYAASKGGLLQLSRWLSTVLAPSVRVNCISPGGVARQQPEAFQVRYNARTPLQRMATEEDLKGAVVYLASDLSAYVTGQNLVVDGGWMAW